MFLEKAGALQMSSALLPKLQGELTRHTRPIPNFLFCFFISIWPSLGDVREPGLADPQTAACRQYIRARDYLEVVDSSALPAAARLIVKDSVLSGLASDEEHGYLSRSADRILCAGLGLGQFLGRDRVRAVDEPL